VARGAGPERAGHRLIAAAEASWSAPRRVRTHRGGSLRRGPWRPSPRPVARPALPADGWGACVPERLPAPCHGNPSRGAARRPQPTGAPRSWSRLSGRGTFPAPRAPSARARLPPGPRTSQEIAVGSDRLARDVLCPRRVAAPLVVVVEGRAGRRDPDPTSRRAAAASRGRREAARDADRHRDLLGAALASGDPTGGSAKPDVAQAFASCSGALADRRRRHSAGTTATPIIVTSATAKSSGYEPNP